MGVNKSFDDFWALEQRFEAEPTIENYVALRRSFIRCDTEIHRFAGVDPMQALGHDLEQAGFDRSLVCGALGGDDRDIDELCLQIMERLIERRRLAAKGETHLQARGDGISDALIGHLIIAMLEVLQQDGLTPRPSFVLLVREQLGGANTEIYKSHIKWADRNRAVFLGMQIKRRGAQPTIRKIAEIMGVQPSTVSRWFPDGDFLELVDNFEKSFVTFKGDDGVAR
jgi:hypothetical protein